MLKSSNITRIKEDIRMVAARGSSLDPSVATFLLRTLKDRLPKTDVQNTLSDMEMEILTLFGGGLVKKEIAARLGIS